jgi:short-subunit dehydrogenase
MTFGMDDSPPLMAEPERVAKRIVWAIEKEKDVCYAPPIWRYIMAAIRLIPARLFKRLDL